MNLPLNEAKSIITQPDAGTASILWKCGWLRGLGAAGKVSELLQASLMVSDVSQRFPPECPRTLEKGSGVRRSGLEMGVFQWDLQAGNSQG